MQGLACIGAPVFECRGLVVGSISLSGDPGRILGDQREYFATELSNTAIEISQYMGHFPAAMDAQRP